jgi:acetoin utilization protein AcuB
MQLVDIGGARVVTIGPDDSIDYAIALLDENEFRHLPVVERGRILGMVADRDLLSAVGMQKEADRVSSLPGPSRIGATRIREIMSSPVTTISADAPVEDGASIMIEQGIRALPLVYRDRLAGIVTITDFLKCYLSDATIAKMKGWRLKKVGDHMTTDVVTLGPTDSFRHAARVMQSHKFRHAPIVEDNKLIGIVSDRDMRRFLGNYEIEYEERPEEIRHGRVEVSMWDVMTRDPQTTHARETLAEVAEIMVRRHFGALPVMDEGKLVGIITELDLLRHFVAACRGPEAQ